MQNTSLRNFWRDLRFLPVALVLSCALPIKKLRLEGWEVIAMVKVRHERALMGEKPHCPDCERVALRRQGRVGFLQRVVYPRFGLFPWECGLCRKIFMLSQRSTDYRQHATSDEVMAEAAPETTSEIKAVPRGGIIRPDRSERTDRLDQPDRSERPDRLPGVGLAAASWPRAEHSRASRHRANEAKKIAG